MVVVAHQRRHTTVDSPPPVDNDKSCGPPYTPRYNSLSHPRHPRKKVIDEDFDRFLDCFLSIKINFPLIETMKRIPSYGQSFKKFIIDKRKFYPNDIFSLRGFCSVVV